MGTVSAIHNRILQICYDKAENKEENPHVSFGACRRIVIFLLSYFAHSYFSFSLLKYE